MTRPSRRDEGRWAFWTRLRFLTAHAETLADEDEAMEVDTVAEDVDKVSSAD